MVMIVRDSLGWLSIRCVGMLIASVWGTGLADFVLQPVVAQESAALAVEEKTEEKESAKARRERLAAEVKKQAAKSDAETDETTKTKVQLLAPSGNYVDFSDAIGIDPASLFLGSGPIKQKSFYRLCEFLDELAKNESIAWVALDLSDSNLAMNPAQLDELGRRLANLKKSGKKLVAWLESASSEHLSIAASCDQVVMADFGCIDFPSASLQTVFYREAMDLLGIKASVVRAGDFKGAVEPYMNAQMSEHLRQHYREMLESINDARVAAIAKGRGMTTAAVREVQKQRFLLPQEALSKGLVDSLAPYGSMRATIDAMIEKPTQWVEPTKKAEKEMSVFELMSMMMAGPKKPASRTSAASIAVLHLSGALVDGKEPSTGAIVAGPMVKAIQSLIDDEQVHGVVVRVNSPGGSATASESIRQALKKLSDKKPTVISMGEMAASGGYWVSCIGVPIFAEQGTITGSIGVFSMKISFGTLLRRIGLHFETIALDSSAAAFSLERPWSEEDESVLQATIDDVYQRFLKLVSKSRGLPLEKLEKLAGGRVWSGSQAKVHGLVDEIGGIDDAVAMVAKKAKMDKVRLIHRPEASSGLDLFQLLGDPGEDEILLKMFSRDAIDLVSRSGFSMRTLRLLLKDSEIFTPDRPTVWALMPAEMRVK